MRHAESLDIARSPGRPDRHGRCTMGRILIRPYLTPPV